MKSVSRTYWLEMHWPPRLQVALLFRPSQPAVVWTGRRSCLFSQQCWCPPTGARGKVSAVPAAPTHFGFSLLDCLISQEGRKWSSYPAANLRFIKAESCKKEKSKYGFLLTQQVARVKGKAQQSGAVQRKLKAYPIPKYRGEYQVWSLIGL